MNATSRRSVLGLIGAAPLAAGGVAGASAPAARVPRELRPGGELDRYLTELAEEGTFTGSVLLTHRGDTVLARSHGMANRDAGIANAPDTIFHLGSGTKLFTAVAVAQLARRGALRFQDPIGRYADGFPPEIAETVTVHHLLTHSAGMGNFQQSAEYQDQAPTWETHDEMMNGILDIVRATRLDYAPGAGQRYSNSGYVTLGAVLAGAAERNYFAYIREHVFQAADMTTADFSSKHEWRTNPLFARPYTHQDTESEEPVDAIERHDSTGTPAGGSFASCRDLDRFCQALRSGDLLDPASVSLVLTPKAPLLRPPPQEPPTRPTAEGAEAFYTYGASTYVAGDRWAVERGGDSPGVSVGFTVFQPDNDWVLVSLSNVDALPRDGQKISPARLITDEATRILGER
ncbi:serine hydrolase domain-containing protein [Streptomyces sp. SBT349]|uniref:serine hydrolase domain-containing protein n=1 Tax=Streptomyces sp. SBT349 TaxID=1580539 RepID=UPI00066D6728|nr:serine hydrolase domain-containing protein [Streptomyces sp. SBT349]